MCDELVRDALKHGTSKEMWPHLTSASCSFREQALLSACRVARHSATQAVQHRFEAGLQVGIASNA